MSILEAPEQEGVASLQAPSAPCSHAAPGQAAGRQADLEDQPACMDLSAGAAVDDSSSDDEEVPPRRCSDPGSKGSSGGCMRR